MTGFYRVSIESGRDWPNGTGFYRVFSVCYRVQVSVTGFFLLLLPGFDGVTETRSIMTGNVGQMAHNWSWEPAGVFSFFFLFCLFSFYCRTIPFIGLSNGSTEFLPSFLFSFGRQEGREAAIVRGGGISISFFGAFFPFFFPLFLFGFFCWRPFFVCVCACVCFVLRAPSLTRPKANGH